MVNFIDISIVRFSKVFLKLSWVWLRDKEIMEMTNTPVFTRQEQLRWYNELGKKENYRIWGVQAGQKKIGACGLKNITAVDCEYWGYIGEKEFWGKGIGSIIINLMENEAAKLGLQSIWLQVLNNNSRAYNLYIKMNFRREKSNGKLIFMRKIVQTRNQ